MGGDLNKECFGVLCLCVCMRRKGELHRLNPVKEFSCKHSVVMEPASREQTGGCTHLPLDAFTSRLGLNHYQSTKVPKYGEGRVRVTIILNPVNPVVSCYRQDANSMGLV